MDHPRTSPSGSDARDILATGLSFCSPSGVEPSAQIGGAKSIVLLGSADTV